MVRRHFPCLRFLPPFRAARRIAAGLLIATGCSRGPLPQPREVAYVKEARVVLRDPLGPSSREVGHLKIGEPVEVLAKRPFWAHVRSQGGQTGWVQTRSLASPDIVRQFRRLAAETGALPPQGMAILRREANLHLEPDGGSETFYRLPEGEEVEVLLHRAIRQPAPLAARGSERIPDQKATPESSLEWQVQAHEDWMLVRVGGNKAGWLLENILEMNLPVEIASYREGLRIRAWFVLHRERAEGGEHPWYLWATIRPRAGLPFDFDAIRVFVWNPSQSRYETAYRERGLIGLYPIHVGAQETPRGPSPAFSLQLEDETGKRFQKNYVMVDRQVRRAS